MLGEDDYYDLQAVVVKADSYGLSMGLSPLLSPPIAAVKGGDPSKPCGVGSGCGKGCGKESKRVKLQPAACFPEPGCLRFFHAVAVLAVPGPG